MLRNVSIILTVQYLLLLFLSSFLSHHVTPLSDAIYLHILRYEPETFTPTRSSFVRDRNITTKLELNSPPFPRGETFFTANEIQLTSAPTNVHVLRPSRRSLVDASSCQSELFSNFVRQNEAASIVIKRTRIVSWLLGVQKFESPSPNGR